MDKPVIIIGTGGHAKVVAECLYQSDREILGFVAPGMTPGTHFLNSTILGDDEIITDFSPKNIELANGLGSLPCENRRWELAAKMRHDGYFFTRVIHPSALIGTDVKLAEGVQIMAGTVIQTGSQVGKDSIINTGALVDHDCNIAENCHLAPGIVCSGSVRIASNSHLGTGTIVVQNISIGQNCVIAAGSVVYKDVPSHMLFIQKKQLIISKKMG